MKKLLLVMFYVSCCLCSSAQTTRFINVGITVNTPQQSWTLSTIYAKPFFTTLTWLVKCKDMTTSVYVPDNDYIEDMDTHIRYGLVNEPRLINPSSFNQSIKYELTFKAIPSTVRALKFVGPDFTINDILINKNSNNKNEIAVVEVNSKGVEEKQIIDENYKEEQGKHLTIISDIDIDIPQIENEKAYSFAIIIANENYDEEEDVPYALNDGKIVQQYCTNVLGIPSSNIKFITDATLNNIKRQISWINEVMDAYNGEANIIFYYAGHGIPDESNRTSYLLPVDGVGNDVSTGYSLDKLYADLSSKPAKSVVVLLDACFSGAKRDGGMLASTRGVAIKAKQNEPKGNMVVISAAQGDETAYPYEEKGHGMFTYYLLKKLQETKGDVTLGDLADYVTSEVKKRSVVVNGKMQTPIATASNNAADWRNWKLR